MKKLICMLLAVVMVMAMVACGDENKEAYEAAVAAYNAGNYEEASVMLIALGDYKVAAQLLGSIKAEKTGVTTTVTTAEGDVTTTTEYVFKDGNLIKETITLADGTVVKNYYKYDENGLCTSETLNQADGGKVVINHLYENGIKVRSIRTNADKSKDTYEYTCDANGKVTSHVLTLSNGTTEEAIYTYSDVTGLLASIETANTLTAYGYNQFNDISVEAVAVDGKDVSTTSYDYDYICTIG